MRHEVMGWQGPRGPRRSRRDPLTMLWSLPGLAPGRTSHVHLRSRWVVPVAEPLILVSQVPRAGGTLLGRLFDDHPECFAHPYELQWGKVPPVMAAWPEIEPGISARVAFERLRERWIPRFLQRGAYEKSHGDRHPFIFDRTLQARLFVSQVTAGPAGPRDVLNAYFTALFNAWLDCQHLYREPKRFVTAFSPGFHVDPANRAGFWRDYPDGYFVSLVREPVSWFASARAFVSTRPLFDDVDGAIQMWRTSTEATLDAHDERPDRTIVVVFEDLVRRTDAVMRRICERTGLSYGEALLRPTFNGRPVLSDTSFEPKHDIDRSAADRATRVSGAHAALIATATRALYDRVRARFGAADD